jgi:zinc and cadmium transporter
MGSVWIATFVSVAAVSAIPLAGLWLLSARPAAVDRAGSYLISFAVGALLGGALLHLLPAALERLGSGPAVPLAFLGGFVGFFALERFLWTHEHRRPRAVAGAARPVAVLSVIGDGLHNLLDGMVIAAAYAAAPAIGLATTVAVILHEIPQEVGDFGVLVHSGLPVRRAVLWNALSGATALLGALVMLVVGTQVAGAATALLPVAAGGFVYIAASDLVPELHRVRTPRAGAWQLALILLGIAVMGVPALLEGSGAP